MSTENKGEVSSPEMNIKDRIIELGQELLATSFSFIARIRAGEKISAEEQTKQTDAMKEFKNLKGIYNDLAKMKLVDTKLNKNGDSEKFERGVLDKIKEKKTAIGDIVQKIKD